MLPAHTRVLLCILFSYLIQGSALRDLICILLPTFLYKGDPPGIDLDYVSGIYLSTVVVGSVQGAQTVCGSFINTTQYC